MNLTDDYDQGKPEVRVRVDRVQASVAGVNTREIARAIQTAIRGAEASTYRIGEDKYDIRVRLAPETRSLDALKNLTVSDEDGLQIPLRTVVELESGVGPGAVRRVDSAPGRDHRRRRRPRGGTHGGFGAGRGRRPPRAASRVPADGTAALGSGRAGSLTGGTVRSCKSCVSI